MTTLAPSCAKRTAIAWPMPEEAPVMSAFFPSSFNMNLSCQRQNPFPLQVYSAEYMPASRAFNGMRQKTLLLKSAGVALVFLCAAAAFAGKVDPLYKTGKGVAIKGYDPVGYFQQNQPTKGSPQFAHEWMGATWLF